MLSRQGSRNCREHVRLIPEVQVKLWTSSKLSVVPISLLQRRKTGRSGYGSDVSNVNYLTEPVSNNMPYHRDV